ncbi:TetR/AcrR family transcriptional regulator [Cytobacillus purgationiresistens]|uniref:AcrR family transcriptional regulator n=1 Tax=Cytobacillus purgationiresistens TaxID=863449 RepID=A0ABU0AN76_9BACI|nr:TetR/AcrR family transcriptional regulator [Cytobacillus purgationiresistens]MDQ0272633.1 AcrR family transcriptional regulator [Cytobacillus purgationiresistens]
MGRERKFSNDELFKHTKELLLLVGYEGFTFSMLAEKMEVSRATFYKYFENKEELITEFMIHEMNEFLVKLKKVETYANFNEQFEYLMDIIFERTEIQELIEITMQVQSNSNNKARLNKEQFEDMRLNMYSCLQSFITLGKKEDRLNAQVPDTLILGFIFQSVAIPNHFNLPRKEWVQSIKEVISNGILS